MEAVKLVAVPIVRLAVTKYFSVPDNGSGLNDAPGKSSLQIVSVAEVTAGVVGVLI